MNKTNQIIDAAVTFFNDFAPAHRGFYIPKSLRADEDKKFTIQVIEVGEGKKKELTIVAVLCQRANGHFHETADKELASLVDQVNLAILEDSKGVNQALDGLALQFELIEPIKIMPPESYDPEAKAAFTAKITYI
ncbi:hypothetical protein JL49_13305 [Pseudoalteromonas luteoviolacea]|nr:hypothetical protein JL49_13305 [Pseudoalteromonas luteoviolacea]